MYEYSANLKNVVDGDTYDLHIDLGLRIYSKARVRLLGVDTPEIFSVKRDTPEWKRGHAAKTYVEEWFAAHGPTFRIRTHKDETGKYGRWLVEVSDLESGEDLAEKLVAAGHAERVEY